MKTQHTPGPWKLSSNMPGDEYATVILGGLQYIGIIARAALSPYWDIEQSEANAKLIAAAPDLLEVLREINQSETLQKHLGEKAEAAIKKATE